uniref:DH domain-containing protein n=1 Tax=Hucho hucho TaxID=62062 RepID=A0A4W5RZJ2_9TELE
MFEVLTSEASYVRSLRVLNEHFLESRELEEVLIIRDRKTLFSNVLRVLEVSESFLMALENRKEESLVFSDICDIIHFHAQHNFPVYIDYVRNQIYQDKTYTSLMKTNVDFATVITRLQESPQCQRLPFMSFLLLPFQRITRIKILIENILKRTNEGTNEEQTASKALDSVSKIIEECNTQVGKMKQVEELIHLSKTLEFDKLKAIPIISQTRVLEKRGELQEMAKGNTLFNLGHKFTPVYLFLFNDLLIIATKKGSERFVVLDHAHRTLVQVQPIGDDQASNPSYEHCFCLTLLENHQGRMMERLMKA